MRRSLLLLLLIVLGACEGAPSEPSESRIGSFSGRWDDELWRGRAYAVLEGDTLTVVGHRPDPKAYYDEYVWARVRFTGEGTYPVSGRSGMLEKIFGGDAGYFWFADGTLTITRYDAHARTVSGEISLTAAEAKPAWHAAGVFHAPVYASSRDVPQVR